MGVTANASNNPARPHQILWLPCLPSAGSLSMDRYWTELEHRRRGQPQDDLAITCALSGPPVATRRRDRLTRFWQKYLWYPVRARRVAAGADLVHVLDHTHANLLREVPPGTIKVATVHDLAPLRVPGTLTTGQRRRFHRVVATLCEADLLLADSRHTARDVVELLGCDEARIRVLPLGADLVQFHTPQPAPLADWETRMAGRQVIISVGSVAERKNLAMLPDFLVRLRAAGWPVTLVRIGDELPSALARELRGVLGPELLELGKVSAEHLAGAYQRAALLIFPSRLEGFGLPVLEAMAAGCPVVCSDASSLPEVGGDAALYFGPDDNGAAAAQAEILLRGGEARGERIRAGRARAERFSWQTHFTALMEIYRGLLARGGRN